MLACHKNFAKVIRILDYYNGGNNVSFSAIHSHRQHRVHAILVLLAVTLILNSFMFLTASAKADAANAADSWIKITKVTPNYASGKVTVQYKVLQEIKKSNHMTVTLGWKNAQSSSLSGQVTVTGKRGTRTTTFSKGLSNQVPAVLKVYTKVVAPRSTGSTSRNVLFAPKAKTYFSTVTLQDQVMAWTVNEIAFTVLKGAKPLRSAVKRTKKRLAVHGKSTDFSKICPTVKKGNYIRTHSSYSMSGNTGTYKAKITIWKSKKDYTAKKKSLCYYTQTYKLS